MSYNEARVASTQENIDKLLAAGYNNCCARAGEVSVYCERWVDHKAIHTGYEDDDLVDLDEWLAMPNPPRVAGIDTSFSSDGLFVTVGCTTVPFEEVEMVYNEMRRLQGDVPKTAA